MLVQEPRVTFIRIYNILILRVGLMFDNGRALCSEHKIFVCIMSGHKAAETSFSSVQS